VVATPFASPEPRGDDRAYLDFVLGLRTHWARRLYPKLRAEYQARTASAPPATPEEASPVIDALPSASLFGWMERNAQKMMWRRLDGLIGPRDAELSAMLEQPVPNALGSVELDPNLELPAYYRETEFHIQPGGVWSSAANAFVYEVGAKIVMFGQNDDYLFHRLFAQTALPELGSPRAVLDMACGFGKSTRPLCDRYPDAEIVGIDLSAANLMLAHHQAERLGKRITFSQRMAEDTRFPDGSFGLVTGTMFLHEVPMPVLRRVLTEANRVLAPGGWIAFLEFGRTGDVFRDAVMDDHGARNNEPFMPHLFRTDLKRLCADVGFVDTELRAFDERGAGLLPGERWPERDDWHFPWAVLRARKPCPT
jgi:ubiquinone/menaquinone biosynthesis C-methylase UbiE